MKHCCYQLQDNLLDERVQLFYDLVVREVYIPLRRNVARQTITHCPFCGKRLPESVREHYYDLLGDDYNGEHHKSFKAKSGGGIGIYERCLYR